jgi:hypothetical protein
VQRQFGKPRPIVTIFTSPIKRGTQFASFLK